jgi:DNA-binding NarL/FixJ family response regulator
MSLALLLSDDFLFISRIQGHARAANLTVDSVRRPSDLVARANDKRPSCVLIDLHVDGLEIAAVVPELKALDPAPFLVGYGSHVDVATLKAAREAGCDLVLPRSKFVEELPTSLGKWMA